MKTTIKSLVFAVLALALTMSCSSDSDNGVNIPQSIPQSGLNAILTKGSGKWFVDFLEIKPDGSEFAGWLPSYVYYPERLLSEDSEYVIYYQFFSDGTVKINDPSLPGSAYPFQAKGEYTINEGTRIVIKYTMQQPIHTVGEKVFNIKQHHKVKLKFNFIAGEYYEVDALITEDTTPLPFSGRTKILVNYDDFFNVINSIPRSR